MGVTKVYSLSRVSPQGEFKPHQELFRNYMTSHAQISVNKRRQIRWKIFVIFVLNIYKQ